MCLWADIRKTKTDYQRDDIILVACLMRLSQLYKDVICIESESSCSDCDSAYLHQLMNRLFDTILSNYDAKIYISRSLIKILI